MVSGHFTLPLQTRYLPEVGLQFLDKTSMGYSSVFGLIPDNHLVGQDYSWAS